MAKEATWAWPAVTKGTRIKRGIVAFSRTVHDMRRAGHLRGLRLPTE
jgi:hypothetical protein